MFGGVAKPIFCTYWEESLKRGANERLKIPKTGFSAWIGPCLYYLNFSFRVQLERASFSSKM